MNKKKTTGIVLSLLAVLSLVLITAGVTYAFFTYAKEGETENTITTGTITFYYDELAAVGNGISIVDALPTDDATGKIQVGADKVFDFNITAQTSGSSSLPYEVTARMKDSSTLAQDAVKLYLTTVQSGNVETDGPLTIAPDSSVRTFDTLTQSVTVPVGTAVEKTIYNGTIPASSANYTQDFRLRMWLSDQVDFSPEVDDNGNDVYPYNGKTFSVTINVYANATVVSAS